MGRKQKLRQEKHKIKNNPRPLLSVAAAITATVSKTVAAAAPAAIIVPPDKMKNNPQPLMSVAATTATASKTVRSKRKANMASWFLTIRIPNRDQDSLKLKCDNGSLNYKIKDIKLTIQNSRVGLELELDAVRQRLVYNGRILDDDERTLGDYGIVNQSTLFLNLISSASASANADAERRRIVEKCLPHVQIIVPPYVPYDHLFETDSNAFPKSHFHKVGAGLLEVERFDSALDAFKRGAAETGCVPCMLEYARVHIYVHKQGNMILRLPWILEGAIRGHTNCLFMLYYDFYCEGSEYKMDATALGDYWLRIFISMAPNTPSNMPFTATELRKNQKELIGTSCFICSKTDTKILTLQQCKGCSFHCYCSETCQTIHWNEHNHRGECKQLQILNKYHKPYAKIIRKAIIRGDDPKHIPELQTLRNKLGLNRPEEDYRELVELLSTDDNDDSDIGTSCFICSKIDTNTLPLKQCIGCSFYCYCSEDCQSKHWDEMNHRGECRQLNILNDYHKPYAKRIRKAIIRGDDPKHIPELQTLRTKLDLNRPKEDYKELVDLLNTDNDDDDDDDDDDDNLWNHRIADKLMGRPNPYRYVTTEKGTVHIGSTPELI